MFKVIIWVLCIIILLWLMLGPFNNQPAKGGSVTGVCSSINEHEITDSLIMNIYEAGYYSGAIRQKEKYNISKTWVIDSTAFRKHFFSALTLPYNKQNHAY